jgi:adenine-specific DNA-methyltransferase
MRQSTATTSADSARLMRRVPTVLPDYGVFEGDCMRFLGRLPLKEMFDLVVTSPPYNIGKPYESKRSLEDYLRWQVDIFDAILPRLKASGSLCWQIGNFVENGVIEPLDIYLHPLFKSRGLSLRNRIVWRYGHGLHCKRRFSGRYEVILWYTKSDDYVFNLNAVRVSSKYPGKRFYKGPRAGQLSGHPKGKNPEDVWDIPNVKSQHREKTVHPCQFPVGLAERLILALTRRHGLVFDPFAGVCTSGVAAALHERRFLGCELQENYAAIGVERMDNALRGTLPYRPHDIPVFDHRLSPLAVRPRA